MSQPDKKRRDKDRGFYDADADQPEVIYDETTSPDQQKPSQAEGERETVEEDLDEKSPEEDE